MMTLINHRVISLCIAGLLCLLSMTTAQAAYQRGYLNLGFESPVIATGTNVCRVYISSTRVPGWLTTHPYANEETNGTCSISTTGAGQLMEMWAGSRNIGGGTATTDTIKAREGNQFVELNAAAISEISQNICLVNGEQVSWKFSHNGRNTTNDTMVFRAGTQRIATVSTSIQGAGQVTNCASGTCNNVVSGSGSGVGTTTGSSIARWADYSGTFTYSGATGLTPMGFQSTSGSSTNGNFLDAIQIGVKPIIEFSSATYTVPENGGTAQPVKVIVVGDVPDAGIPLTFTVNDGTAQLGLDYKINGGTNNTFTITVPKGNYGAGTPYILEVPVETINDTINENDETFTVTIKQSDDFHVMSSNVCGASGNGTATYTIIDDDAATDQDVKVEKKQRIGTSGDWLSTPIVAKLNDTIQYQLVFTNKMNKAIAQTSPASFTDVVPSNITGLTVVSRSPNDAKCTASFSGNTLTGQFYGAAGATCTVVIQGSGNIGGILTNTANVTAPGGNSNDIFLSDNSNSVQTTIARAAITLTKSSIGGMGTFGYVLGNTTQTTGSVTTLSPGEEYQVDGDSSVDGVQSFIVVNTGDVTINENSLPSGENWTLTGASCRNSSGTQIGSRSGTTYTITSAEITSNATINCNFVNTKPPRIKIKKESRGGVGKFDFTMNNTSLSSTSVTTTLQTGSTNIGTGTSSDLTVSDILKEVTLTETSGSLPTGYALKNISCLDANSAVTGNIGNIGTRNGYVLTIPVNNLIIGGADITCTFVNSKPTLTIKKISRGGVGKFDFTGTNGILNHSITTTATETETSGDTQYFTTATPSADVTITESGMPTGFRLTNAVCTGMTTGGTATPNYTNNTVTLTKNGIGLGTDIVCTLTNTLTTLTLIKKWENAITGDSTTVNSIGLSSNATTGLSVVDATGANSTTGTPVILTSAMIGKTASIIESFTKGEVDDYTGTLVCTGNNTPLSGNSLTINSNDAAIICTLTNSRKDLVLISGRIFNDNGGTTNNIVTNAYNALQDANEIGIAGSSLKLANCSGVDLNVVTVSNANGEYSFKVEKNILTSPFCIIQTNLPEYTSVSGASPTGTYNRANDRISLAKTTATSYPDNNFGDANLNVVLTEDGQHTTTAGDVTDYPHRLSTQAPVQLTQLVQTQIQQPASTIDQPWQTVIYRDTNCNGTVDAGESVFSPTSISSVLLQPNTDICLVQRVHVPTNVGTGAQHTGSLQASYEVSLTNPVEKISKQTTKRQDVTLIGSAGLTLTKKVRTVTDCASASTATNSFLLNNEATKQQSLEYEITYKNNSTKNLKAITIKDFLPTGTSFGSISCAVTPTGNTCNTSSSGSMLQWNLTDILKPAQTGTVRFCVTPAS